MSTVRSIEQFVIDYITSAGGLIQQIEPQVYDLLLPTNLSVEQSLFEKNDNGIARISFEPEALSEHPGARLITFGDPALDAMFQDAIKRGRMAKVYSPEQNLTPYQLDKQMQKEINKTSDLTLTFDKPTIHYFSTAIFWFQGTFLSDEKQQYLFQIGVDLFYGRLVRNTQELLNMDEIVSSRYLPYPDAIRKSVLDVYPIAREKCADKVHSEGRKLHIDLEAQFTKEAERIRRYFRDLRNEIEEKQKKKEEIPSSEEKKRILVLEEKTRLADLRKKISLKVQIKLVNLLNLCQPKLLIPTCIETKRGTMVRTDAVWDPKTMNTEPLECPTCGQPTLDLFTAKNSQHIVCKICKHRYS